MAWNDPSLAAYHGQPASQASIETSNDFERLQGPALWDPIQVRDLPISEKSRMPMAGPAPQNAFMSSMPAMSEITSCGTLVTTSWASDGTLLTQVTPRLGSDSCTSQELSPQASTAPGSSSSKSNQQHHALSDMNGAAEVNQQGAVAPPLPKGVPRQSEESSAGGGSRAESDPTTLETDVTSSGRSSWQRDTESSNSHDDSGSRATKSQEGCNGRGDSSNTSGCSRAHPQPTQTHRARNRKAATKCRAKAKAAKEELEDTEREMETKHQELSAQASDLQNEVLALKNELLMHGNCDCDVIQQYFSNAAKNIIDSGNA